MAIMVNMQEAKTNLSKLVASIQRGEKVTIANRGVPVAKLEPIHPPQKRTLGFFPGEVPDGFFEPLPEAELQAWGMS